MSLHNYTDDELKAEIDRRIQEENDRVFTVQTKMDWDNVIRAIEDYVLVARRDKYLLKDFDHYLFETVMETVYGKDIWKWWNKIVG